MNATRLGFFYCSQFPLRPCKVSTASGNSGYQSKCFLVPLSTELSKMGADVSPEAPQHRLSGGCSCECEASVLSKIHHGAFLCVQFIMNI